MTTCRSLIVPSTSVSPLEVRNLGTITGVSYNDGECIQYLGIKYAEVPGRFRRSVPTPEPWPNNAWDGTKLGPYCPQPPRDFYPVPDPPLRTWVNTPGTDELNCLNLNISVPKHDATKGPLPVMVFFHGGAYTYSTGASPIYDGRLLATSSSLDGDTPTIIVTLNYRLGVYGFLAGTDLKAYSNMHGESGTGNYGLWDQVLALRWIQKHISSFGGDPKRVCIFGQSAGSQSVACHLSRGEQLFSSAIMQSGLLSLCGIFTPEQYQVVFEKMLVELGISLELSPVERAEALANAPEEAVTKAMTPVFGIPVVTMALCDDGVLLPDMTTAADLLNFKLPEFVDRVMIGDALHECIIWNKSWRHLSAPDLLKTIAEFLGEKADLVATLYGINPSLSEKETFDAIERMTTDGLYRIPNHLAEIAVPNCFAYHFNVPSPYENEWGGLCHHSFDNVLLWGALEHTLPTEQQEISKEMRAMFIKFANSVDPWEPVGERGNFCVLGPRAVSQQTRVQFDAKAYEIWNRLKEEELVEPLWKLSEELNLQRRRLLSM
ncbi:Fc.00g069630.m01.CDS01 [Cosmosporella sp. VM-42]